MDFNDGQTAGLARFDLLALELIERRYNLIQAIEEAHKPYFNGSQLNMNIVKARLLSLYFTLLSALKNSLPPEQLEILNQIVLYEDYNDIIKCFQIIDKWLYDKNITKIDGKILIKTGRMEQKNKLRGLI